MFSLCCVFCKFYLNVYHGVYTVLAKYMTKHLKSYIIVCFLFVFCLIFAGSAIVKILLLASMKPFNIKKTHDRTAGVIFFKKITKNKLAVEMYTNILHILKCIDIF